MSSFHVAVIARLCPLLLWHSRGSWLLPHTGQAAPGLAFPSDLTVLDLRSVALKAWCLDAAEQTECPSLCLCPLQRAPAQAALGRGGLHSYMLSWLAVFDVSWKAGPTTPVLGRRLVRWRPQASGRSRVPTASHHSALTSLPRLICLGERLKGERSMPSPLQPSPWEASVKASHRVLTTASSLPVQEACCCSGPGNGMQGMEGKSWQWFLEKGAKS